MSEKIFGYEKIATNAVLVMLIFIVLFIIVHFIKTIRIKCLKKKINKQRLILDEAEEIVNGKVDHILRIQKNSDDEKFKESLLKEIIRNEEKSVYFKRECKTEIEKLERKLDRAEKLDIIRLLFSLGVIGAFCVIVSIVPRIGGRVSNIKKMDYENQNIRINAYYTVSYSGTDQITVTMYVKNNSGKSLRSASIMQKETGSTAKITNLDPGEEKIVSINSYKGDKYEFELQEIVFNE